jgi:hypothetical protein
LATEARRRAARTVGRTALGAVLGAFGAMELTAPAQWTVFVPPAVAHLLPPVPLVLVHGWFLLVLGTALVVEFLPALSPWLAVAVLGEVVVGLVWAGGFSTTLVRDTGLLALAVAVALDQEAPRAGSRGHAGTGPGPQAVRSRA